METYINPPQDQWNELTSRPVFEKNRLNTIVFDILRDVRVDGDTALRKYSEKFDGVSSTNMLISDSEKDLAQTKVSEELKEALRQS